MTLSCLAVLGSAAGAVDDILPNYSDAVERVLPTVVNIGIVDAAPEEGHAGHDHGPLAPHAEELQGAGAGFIISEDGLVVTCNHVIGDSEIIAIKMYKGQLIRGTRAKMVVGVDPDADVALLRIPREFLPENVPVAVLGDSEAVKVGQPTFAVGHPAGFPFTATFGHISGLGRSNLNFGTKVQILDQDFIQHQTYISPGSSGGPLVNKDGEVIGLNVGVNKANNAIAFAIPINQVRPVVEVLRRHGRPLFPEFGITGVPSIADDNRRGLKVVDVRPRSGAAEAGVQPLDLLLEVDGKPVRNQFDLLRAQRRVMPHAVVELAVLRDDEIVLCRVTPRLPKPMAEMDRAVPMPPQVMTWKGWIFADESGQVVVRSAVNQESTGLQAGWIVEEVDGKVIHNLSDFFARLKAADGWQSPCDLTVLAGPGGKRQRVRL